MTCRITLYRKHATGGTASMILARWFLQAILSVAVRERNVLLMWGNPSARDFGCHLSWQDGSGWQGDNVRIIGLWLRMDVPSHIAWVSSLPESGTVTKSSFELLILMGNSKGSALRLRKRCVCRNLSA
jgi:hypothetical protein